jgi:hypothetical protein
MISCLVPNAATGVAGDQLCRHAQPVEGLGTARSWPAPSDRACQCQIRMIEAVCGVISAEAVGVHLCAAASSMRESAQEVTIGGLPLERADVLAA